MDLLERIAVQLHEGWWRFQLQLGRKLGPVRSRDTHPHMLPWSELDLETTNQDRFIAALILHDWLAARLSVGDLPRAIHEAWTSWEHAHGRSHPHAQPFALAHAHGPDEHAIQAQLVAAILDELPQLPSDRGSRAG